MVTLKMKVTVLVHDFGTSNSSNEFLYNQEMFLDKKWTVLPRVNEIFEMGDPNHVSYFIRLKVINIVHKLDENIVEVWLASVKGSEAHIEELEKLGWSKV